MTSDVIDSFVPAIDASAQFRPEEFRGVVADAARMLWDIEKETNLQTA